MQSAPTFVVFGLHALGSGACTTTSAVMASPVAGLKVVLMMLPADSPQMVPSDSARFEQASVLSQAKFVLSVKVRGKVGIVVQSAGSWISHDASEGCV